MNGVDEPGTGTCLRTPLRIKERPVVNTKLHSPTNFSKRFPSPTSSFADCHHRHRYSTPVATAYLNVVIFILSTFWVLEESPSSRRISTTVHAGIYVRFLTHHRIRSRNNVYCDSVAFIPRLFFISHVPILYVCERHAGHTVTLSMP